MLRLNLGSTVSLTNPLALGAASSFLRLAASASSASSPPHKTLSLSVPI
eukprot:CAMPEP_0175073244 /NCGR_PEP_ID=MMETSP0052_2-20121109/20420_1 /TAXON_ID=51329 ORGANISM="Polytomella parva, Strain SAG 63-3" /NCGR_SAMPLE_ID=MMETSP0052_2 /ASSEMBLY_ACC=CAM_ASM_000194 /LENGTH=48 /DNA_ID= /DNA_START= /DNA_END= /DNA_ORIENTATION=